MALEDRRKWPTVAGRLLDRRWEVRNGRRISFWIIGPAITIYIMVQYVWIIRISWNFGENVSTNRASRLRPTAPLARFNLAGRAVRGLKPDVATGAEPERVKFN